MYRISPQLNRGDWQIQNESNFIDIVSLFERHIIMLFTSMFICSLSKRVQEQHIVVFIPPKCVLGICEKKCNYKKRNISQSKADAVAFWF